MTKTALAGIGAAVLIAAAAATFVPNAHAGVTCATDAAAEVAGATVTGPRTAWNPPDWTFNMPDINETIDAQGNTQADAAAVVVAELQAEISAECAKQSTTTQAAAPASQGLSPTTTAANLSAPAPAPTIASVTYIGDAWGPVPIWRVTYSNGDMVDVAANDAASAEAAVTASFPSGPRVAPTTTTAQTTTAATTTSATTTTGAPSQGQTFTTPLAPPPNSPGSPAAMYALLNG